MDVRLEENWRFRSSWATMDNAFRGDDPESDIGQLNAFLSEEPDFYPPRERIFRAFDATPLDEIKVVILGQDPYHDGRATGLAFSVEDDRLTPSLRSIYAAVEADVGHTAKRDGDLSPWAEEGVLLLNTVLTVRRGAPGSHSVGGWWQRFTDCVIELISKQHDPVVFLLWGKRAWSKARLIDTERHYVLAAAHPRAHKNALLQLAGCKHFSIANHLLEAHGQSPVRWDRA